MLTPYTGGRRESWTCSRRWMMRGRCFRPRRVRSAVPPHVRFRHSRQRAELAELGGHRRPQDAKQQAQAARATPLIRPYTAYRVSLQYGKARENIHRSVAEGTGLA